MPNPGTRQDWTQRRQGRYTYLRSAGFLTWEAQELSKLLAITPALRLAARERATRYDAFRKVAERRVAARIWRRADVDLYWRTEIIDLYHRNDWFVLGEYLYGTNQPRVAAGTLNPWALYRKAEKIAPGKRHISPWELKPPTGTTRLQKGLVFIQRQERAARTSGAAIQRHMLVGWINAKKRAIESARGLRKAELGVELRRLEALYERAS